MRRWMMAIAVLAAMLAVTPGWGQRRMRPMPPMRMALPRRPLGSGLARLSRLPPKQQEKVLRKDPAFRRLPPDKQQQVLQRLRWFQNLPPQRQAAVLRRLRHLGELTPEQRNGLEGLYEDWRKLPPPQQRQLRRTYASLRRLPPEQQQARLSDSNFQTRFSPQQIDLLRRALALRLPDDLVGAPPR
ncbi:MAG: DUF3106 domain-containing protein [Terriglobales bacterium]